MKYSKQERFYPLQHSRTILANKKVAIVGLGGLGSHSSEYITRMGIGSVVLIDDDVVEESNLPRQGLYTQTDSDKHSFKVDIAEKRLHEINPDANITSLNIRLTKENIQEHLGDVDVILDGTDNLQTRYIINEFCFQHHIPWVYAAATGSIGVVSNFIPGVTPCFRCVYGEIEEDNSSCDLDGIILPALTLITSYQVTEAIKILLDKNPSLDESRYNIWTGEQTTVSNQHFLDEECPVCQKQPTITLTNKPTNLYTICKGDSVQVNTSFELEDLQSEIQQWGFLYVRNKNHMLIESFQTPKDNSWKKLHTPRIVSYKSGKIVFHHISKMTIEKWIQQLSNNITKER